IHAGGARVRDSRHPTPGVREYPTPGARAPPALGALTRPRSPVTRRRRPGRAGSSPARRGRWPPSGACAAPPRRPPAPQPPPARPSLVAAGQVVQVHLLGDAVDGPRQALAQRLGADPELRSQLAPLAPVGALLGKVAILLRQVGADGLEQVLASHDSARRRPG